GKALFAWQKDQRRFRLESLHDGEDVRAQTGFDYDAPPLVPRTPGPSAEDLALLRGPVARQMAPDYPDFTRKVWGID
ncbi:MAG: hypothetical protein ACREUH_01560, partial [Burkholderiales bacterium]